MKKIFSLGLMLVALTLMNCSKEEIVTEAPAVNGAAFELFASTEDGRTVNDGWSTLWDEGDQINVFHAVAGTTEYKNDTPKVDVVEYPFVVKDTESGLFVGDLMGGALAEGTNYDWYLFYPYSSYIVTPANNSAGYTYIGSRSDRSQAQTGVDNMTHIAGSNYPLYGKALDVPANEAPVVTMKNIASLIEFAVKNTESEAIAISEIQFTSTEDIVGSYFIDFSGETLGFTPSRADYVSATGKLSITEATIAAGATAKFYMAVKPHAVSAGDLTIKVMADAGACTKTLEGVTTTFTAGKVKTINFTYVAPAPTPAETWTRITSVDDLVDGKYVILAKDQTGTIGYLPTEVKNTPTFGTQAIFSSIETETYSVSVPEEMVWNFARNSDGNWVLTTNTGDYFFATNTSKGLNVGSTADAWTITAHSKNAEAFAFRNDDVARNAGVYHSSGKGADWRSYDGDTYQNYGTNGVGAQIILYYCGTLAEKTQLATPTVTATAEGKTITVSWTEVANAGSYEVTCGGETPVIVNDALTYTFADLDYETTYEISVVALPATPQTHKASEAGTASATTEPKPADALQTYTWTLATGELGTNGNGTTPLSSIKKGTPSLTWAAQYTWKSNTYLGWSSSYGVQIGSGSNPVTSVTLSTTFGSQIESITIGGATASSGNASVAVKVGDTTFTCNDANTAKMAINNSTAAYKFTTPTAVTGEIVITITNSASKAVYLREIQINK